MPLTVMLVLSVQIVKNYGIARILKQVKISWMLIISDGILSGVMSVASLVKMLKIYSFVQMYGRMFLMCSTLRVVIVSRTVFDVYDSTTMNIIVYLILRIEFMNMRFL